MVRKTDQRRISLAVAIGALGLLAILFVNQDFTLPDLTRSRESSDGIIQVGSRVQVKVGSMCTMQLDGKFGTVLSRAVEPGFSGWFVLMDEPIAGLSTLLFDDSLDCLREIRD